MTKKMENTEMRKVYRKPKLESLGDLRSLTLGGSVGVGESGGAPRKVKVSISPILGHGVPQPDGSVILPDGSVVPPGGY